MGHLERWLVALVWALSACLGEGPASPDADSGPPAAMFVDVTEAAGVAYRQAPPHDQAFYDEHGLSLASHYTGGAAAADVDGDGAVDLLVTRLDAPPILFRNLGSGRLADATAGTGLGLPGMQSVGAAFGDVDNDGDPDLYLTSLGAERFYLFINQGNGTFAEQAEQRGVAVADGMPRQGFSAAFGDYDRDGDLDLFVCEWQYGLPATPEPSHTRLLRNRGADGPGLAGYFEDVTAQAGIDLSHTDVPPGVHAFAANFSDLDDDGYPELLIAVDFEHSRLFWNRGDGTFEDGTTEAGVGTDTHGMGSAVGDYDGDGRLDWFVTSIACYDDNPLCPVAGNRLYRNEGNRTFSDRTDSAGVREGGWGWGATFLDYDNDGWLDLAMVNGNREPNMAPAFADDPSRLWRNQGDGTLAEAQPPALMDDGDGRAIVTLDFDADGDLDLFVVDHVDGGRLLENRSAHNHGFLRLVLQGRVGNRDAFGARVRIRQRPGGPWQLRELRGGNHFLGQNEPVVHFGLGPAAGPVAEVEVTWPSPSGRRVTHLRDVAPNQVLHLREPD